MLPLFCFTACASNITGDVTKRGLTVAEDNIAVFPQGGHTSITCIAYSPDGKFIASGSVDNTVKIWDVATGREFGTLIGHSYSVNSIIYSPDGRYIVSGSGDRTLKLWDAVTCKEVKTFSGHNARVSYVTYSPNGKYIASCSNIDRTVKIWDADSGNAVMTISRFFADGIDSVEFSPDGKYVAFRIITGQSNIKIWNLESNTEIKSLAGNFPFMVFSHDWKYIVNTSGNDFKLLDVNTGEETKTFSGHIARVNSVKFSPDGKYLVSISSDRKIKLWDVSGRNIATLDSISFSSRSTFSPDSNFFVVSDGSSLSLLDVTTCNKIDGFSNSTFNYISTVAYSHDGLYAAVSSGKIVNLWDIASGRIAMSLKGHIENISIITYSPDGKYIATGSYDKTVKIWDAKTGREIRTISKFSDSVTYITYNSNGSFLYIITGDMSKVIKIFDAATGNEIKTIQSTYSDHFDVAIALSPDEKFIAMGYGLRIILTDTNTKEEGPIRADSFTNPNFIVLRNSNDNTGSSNYTFDVSSVAYSPDGKYILSGIFNGTIRMWDISTQSIIKSLSGHFGKVRSIAYSLDGKHIVSGGNDNKIILWDAATGNIIKSFNGHSGAIHSVTFSSDGKQILSGSNDGTTRLWNVTSGKEIIAFASFSGSDSRVATASRGLTVETETASSNIDGEWLSITPDGYYQASPRGDRFLNVRVNNTVTGIDSYRSVFYNPDVVQARLQGRPDPASKTNVTIQQAASFMPPQVTIKSPSTFTTTNTAATNLSVTVTDQNQSIKNIKIFVNGRAITRNELAAIKGNNLQPERTSLTVTGNQRTVNFELPVTLDPGRNLIEVVAFNGYSESARLSPIEVTYNAPAGQQRQLPNLWILAIGVNGYDNSSQVGGNLRFAVADAKRLTDTLKSQEGRRYAKVNSLIIGDGETQLPTTENIRRNLSFLDSAGDRDIVLLFLAGHGVSAQNGRFFFLPKDAVVSGNSGNWRVDEKLAISGEEITAVLEGHGNRLLFIDACQSGGVDNNRMIRAMMESNAFVFAASQGNELSYEDPRWGGGHGAFTFSILNALRGAPAALAENNVSVRSMSGFVSLEVPRMTQNMQNPRVHSLLFADFPLAVIK